MVFSQLAAHEKDAFFSLLDEFRNPYFASRPDLLSNIAKSQGVKTAASAAHDAFKNPAVRNSAADSIKSGLNSARASWNTKREATPEPEEERAHNGSGRVAAAAASFMSHPRFGGSPSPGPPKPPPAPARKASTNLAADDSSSPPLPVNKPPIQRQESAKSSLNSTRTFGSDVDITSAKGFLTTIRHPPKKSNQALANPSSFLPPQSSGGQKKQFGPPPVRRVTSDSSPTSAGIPTPTPPAPPPLPRRKEEPAGEWAEVLYDFTGDEPGDLDIKESQRVLIVERSSEDWWTAELDGKRGTVPAAYLRTV